jgi:hypothetical protein
VGETARVARRLKGRFRRKPALLVLLVVGVTGGFLIFALEARPSASSPAAIGLEKAYVGTTYAFDGAVCLGSATVSSEVLSVEVEQAPGSTAELVRPPEDAAPTLGFPTDDEGRDATGYLVAAGQDDCTLRLLVTPTDKGDVRPGNVRVQLGYGPFGLLRRTAEVRPQVRLEVTAEGEDPRSSR